MPELELKWETRTPKTAGDWREAKIGDPDNGDGVKFWIDRYPTCYRRGPWRLTVHVAEGHGHVLWGCFDEADQPLRNYHGEAAMLAEANAIARVLLKDRMSRDPAPWMKKEEE